METRCNVNINSVKIFWLCARSCKTPSREHYTARTFIESLVVANIDAEQMLGSHGTKRQATLSTGKDLSCSLNQNPQTMFLLLSCLSGGPKQCLHRDFRLLCLLFPFLSCCVAYFPRRFWTWNPSSYSYRLFVSSWAPHTWCGSEIYVTSSHW